MFFDLDRMCMVKTDMSQGLHITRGSQFAQCYFHFAYFADMSELGS